jgi:hypothetical protein
MIEHGSKLFALEAKKELDSIEGVPGTPGVRQFQLAAPIGGGPRPRDFNGIHCLLLARTVGVGRHRVKTRLNRRWLTGAEQVMAHWCSMALHMSQSSEGASLQQVLAKFVWDSLGVTFKFHTTETLGQERLLPICQIRRGSVALSCKQE